MRLQRAFGWIDPVDLSWAAVFFVSYLIVDRSTGVLSELSAGDLGRSSLILAALQRRVLWWGGLVLVAGAAALIVPDVRRRLLARWGELDHGSVLRLLAAPLVVFLAWKGAFYPFNVYAGELHLFDRVLLVVLAVGVFWRPALLIPFAIHSRVITAQTLFPFGTAGSQNVDDLPIIVLLLIAVGHLLFVATGRRSTSLVVLGVGAVLASHFYLPGKGKLAIGWLEVNEVANLPLASYTAGWLGHTDGSVAAGVASMFDRFGSLIKIATMVLELGSLVAVAHRRLLRPFLVGWIVFHLVTFVSTGFFFIGWIMAELGLLIILSRRELRAWVDENTTWTRAAVAVAAVFGSSVLFHPPGLAWIDAPVSHGYRLEATGESGESYLLPATTLAPLDAEVLFKRLQFDGPGHLSGAYGAMESADRLDELNAIETLSDLLAAEADQPEPDETTRATSIQLLTDFLLATADEDIRATTGMLHRLGPPPLFWSSWSDDDYRFSEPLSKIDVVLLTRVHDPSRRSDGIVLTRTDPVLSLVREADGTVTATS